MSRDYIKYRERITQGGILSTLLWLGLPPLITQLVQVSYNIVDSIWLSRLSDIALAVPRQVWPVIMLTFTVGTGFSVANLALISQYVGAKKYSEAEKSASNLFTVMIILGLLFSILIYFMKDFIITNIVSTPKEIYEDTIAYTAIVSWGVFFAFLFFAFSTTLQALGDTKTPTIFAVVSTTINAILDPILIFGIGPFPAMGVAGAALATVLARMITTVAGALLLFRGYKGIRIRLFLHMDKLWLVKSLKIGSPVIALRLANVSSFVVLQRIVNSFGIIAATAYSIGLIAINLSDAILWGFTRAISIMVGQNIGAGLSKRARQVVYQALAIITGGTVIGALIIYALRRSLIMWFTSTPQIIDLADNLVQLFVLSIPFFGMFFTSMSVGSGSGHTVPPSLIGIVRLWVIRIGLGYILSIHLGLGIWWLWLSMSLSNVFAGLAGVAWIVLGRWDIPVIESRKLGYMKYEKKFMDKRFN